MNASPLPMNKEPQEDWLTAGLNTPKKPECLCCNDPDNETALDEATYRRRFELQFDDASLTPVEEIKACSILNPDCDSCQ